MAEPERRRRRPALSCVQCRARKIRCNRGTPCSNCAKSRNTTCVYDSFPPKAQHHRGERPSAASTEQTSAPSTASHVSTPITQPSDNSQDKDDTFSKSMQPTTVTSYVGTDSSQLNASFAMLGRTFHLASKTDPSQSAPVIVRNVKHKTRLFGQSHWCIIVSLFRDTLEMVDPQVKVSASQASQMLHKCKSLGKAIKSQRTPAWPCPPSKDLPSRELADALVDCYLRTSETLYRVLHVPSFKRDYEAIWQPDADPDPEFLVQLKLIFAIGSIAYDADFTLRASAIQWIYEAYTWASQPTFKVRLNLEYIQTNLLLLLARESAGIGEDFIWASAGTLIRMAMYMGLHRDPERLPQTTMFTSEMRRRLWTTIVEVSLQSSMVSGGSPLLSLDDFDTGPPLNFNDEDLEGNGEAVPKPEQDLTQMSIPIALRHTLPSRLAIAKYLNDVGSNCTYEEALRLDGELRTSYRKVRPRFTNRSSYAVKVMDIIVQRYLLSLHIPFYSAAVQNPAFTFSRKVVMDNALKIWSLCTEKGSDIARLAISGSRFLVLIAIQASFSIALEIRTQLREDMSMGLSSVRSDVVAVLKEAQDWTLRGIEIGETNIKGHLFLSVAAADIECIQRGFDKETTSEYLLKAVEEAEERCLPILEAKAAIGTPNFENLDEMTLDPEIWTNWDYVLSAGLFDINNMDIIG